jgi:hypothetical protein
MASGDGRQPADIEGTEVIVTLATFKQDARRVLDYVEAHRERFPTSNDAPFDVTPHRQVYLSTLYRVERGDSRYLFAIKHHDPGGRRAEREYQVLSALGGGIAPRALLFDNSRSVFSDPVLVTTFERPVLIKEWTDANLTRLAGVMAAIHTNADLLRLPVDCGRPPGYSLTREFQDELVDVRTFRDTALKRAIMAMAATLQQECPRWEAAFADNVVTYIHSDLPHHHLFAVEPQWKTVHWEWSRPSHPTRELARALWDMELPPEREAFLIARYAELVPYSVSNEALEIQRLLQSFYNCVHVAYWLDRTEQDLESPSFRKAENLANVVRLWIRMQLQGAA